MRIVDLLEDVGYEVLYHNMALDKALYIFEHDDMPARWAHEIDGALIKGNSFSRNKRFWFHDTCCVKLTIDQSKLKATNKIIPLDAERIYHKTIKSGAAWKIKDRVYNSRKTDAAVMAEEFIIGPIKTLHRVVKQVEVRASHLSAHYLQELVTSAQRWCDKWKVQLVLDPKVKGVVQQRQELEYED